MSFKQQLDEVFKTNISKKEFYSDCVGWPRKYEDVLREIRHGNNTYNISRQEFLKAVNFQGNPKIDIPKNDWHINYSEYSFNNINIYFYTHSGIEYVYASPDDIIILQKIVDEN